MVSDSLLIHLKGRRRRVRLARQLGYGARVRHFHQVLLIAHRVGERLVLGGERDTIFGPKRVAATARAYGTQARMFDMAHDMMLEPGWPAVAAHIGDWLDARALP